MSSRAFKISRIDTGPWGQGTGFGVGEVIGGGMGAEGIQRVEELQPESQSPDSADAAK